MIGTIYGLAKLGLSVRDRLFLKKLLSFLSEVADVPPQQRAQIISRVDRCGSYRIKVGEKLLYLLDKSEDHENVQIVAFLFRALLSGELSYEDFLRASRAVQSIMVADLWRFVDDEKERWDPWVVEELFTGNSIASDVFCEFLVPVSEAIRETWCVEDEPR